MRNMGLGDRRTLHPRRRAEKRFGLVLEPEHIRNICGEIAAFFAKKSGPSNIRLIQRQYGIPESAIVAMKYRGYWMPIVFNIDTGEIKTILPEERLALGLREQNRQRRNGRHPRNGP